MISIGVLIGRDFIVQTLRGVGYEVAMLVHCAALNRRAGPKRRQRFIKARPAIDNNDFRRLQPASGQITMRKVDGWKSLPEKPSDQIIDLAA